MKYSSDIRPISYVKAHASAVIADLNKNHQTMIVTQNGEAKVAIQDIKLYDETQESLALLKILAQSQKSLENGEKKRLDDVFAAVRNAAD